MLKPKVKKTQKFTPQLASEKRISEKDINDLIPQNGKTKFYFKHKVQVLAFGNNNLK